MMILKIGDSFRTFSMYSTVSKTGPIFVMSIYFIRNLSYKITEVLRPGTDALGLNVGRGGGKPQIPLR